MQLEFVLWHKLASMCKTQTGRGGLQKVKRNGLGLSVHGPGRGIKARAGLCATWQQLTLDISLVASDITLQ
jgi:hypothetical protein